MVCHQFEVQVALKRRITKTSLWSREALVLSYKTELCNCCHRRCRMVADGDKEARMTLMTPTEKTGQCGRKALGSLTIILSKLSRFYIRQLDATWWVGGRGVAEHPAEAGQRMWNKHDRVFLSFFRSDTWWASSMEPPAVGPDVNVEHCPNRVSPRSNGYRGSAVRYLVSQIIAHWMHHGRVWKTTSSLNLSMFLGHSMPKSTNSVCIFILLL